MIRIDEPPKRHARRGLLAVLAALCFGPSPQLEATSPRQLVEVADLAGPVVSPDGRRVAFRLEQASIERNTYDTFWYVQDVEGGAPPTRVADGGIPLRDAAGISLPATAVWSPDGRWIYYRARLNDRVGVWRAAADGSGAESITLDPADVRDFSLGADGRTLMYSVGATREQVVEAEQAEYEQGIRIEADVPIGQGLFRSSNIEGRLATQRYFGMWFGRRSLLEETPDRWKAVDLSTREVRGADPAYRPPGPLAASDLAAGPEKPFRMAPEPAGERIALLTRVGEAGEFRDKPDVELSVLPTKASRRPVVCRAEPCTGKAIGTIQWRPARDEVLFTVTDPAEGLAQSIYRWDIHAQRVHPVVSAPGLASGGRDAASPCGVSPEVLVCVVAHADRPPSLERIDLDTGERRLLFDPNAALASDVAATVSARLLRWSDANGQAFSGQLFTARRGSDAPSPLFVTYYTCPGFLRGGLGDEWPLMSLAEHGIAALCIDNPPGYVMEATARYGRAVSAVESVVELLAAEGEIDPASVGMGGLSYGSEVTLWTAIHSNVLAAASITSPSIEPNYYLFNGLRDDAFFGELRKAWGLGSLEETPDRWRTIAPALQTDRIRAPILLQMPEQEYLYALGFAIPLMRQQRADLYVFPHEPHQKFQPKHKLAAYERNLDWFRFWLQGYEDPEPGKRRQYSNWRSMKASLPAGHDRTEGSASSPYSTGNAGSAVGTP